MAKRKNKVISLQSVRDKKQMELFSCSVCYIEIERLRNEIAASLTSLSHREGLQAECKDKNKCIAEMLASVVSELDKYLGKEK